MAEWPIASVLKTEVSKGTVSSNLTSSSKLRIGSANKYIQLLIETVKNDPVILYLGSSIGRALVSKTRGCKFEAYPGCQNLVKCGCDVMVAMSVLEADA